MESHNHQARLGFAHRQAILQSLAACQLVEDSRYKATLRMATPVAKMDHRFVIVSAVAGRSSIAVRRGTVLAAEARTPAAEFAPVAEVVPY